MSTEAHKIAEALGLKYNGTEWVQGNGPTLYLLSQSGIAIPVRSERFLQAWLASPAGEKAVEKRVEELWCKGNFRMWHACGDGEDFELVLADSRKRKWQNDFKIIVPKKRKSAAYAAALLWLAKKGGD